MNKRKIMTLALSLCMVAILAIGGTLAYFTDTTDEIQNTFTLGKVDITLDEAEVDATGKEIVEGGTRVQSNNYTTTKMVPGYVFDKDPTIHVDANSEKSYIFLDMTINKYSSLFWVMAADAAADGKIALYNDEGKLADAFKNDKDVFSTTKFIKYMQDNKETAQYIVNKWFTGITHTNWTVKEIFVGVDKDDVTKNGDYLTLRLAYNDTVVGGTNIQFMESFHMPASVTQKMIEDGKTIGGMKNAFNTAEKNFVMNFKAYAIQASTLTPEKAYEEMF